MSHLNMLAVRQDGPGRRARRLDALQCTRSGVVSESPAWEAMNHSGYSPSEIVRAFAPTCRAPSQLVGGKIRLSTVSDPRATASRASANSGTLFWRPGPSPLSNVDGAHTIAFADETWRAWAAPDASVMISSLVRAR